MSGWEFALVMGGLWAGAVAVILVFFHGARKLDE
jgi:hypothetical protein